MIVWILRISSSIPAVIHVLCVMASLYFRMCVALERCLYITYPLLDCLRQTRSSVLVCVLVWAFCIVSVPLAIVLDELERLIIYAALPGPLFIFCLARTFRGLPAATSVPTEEKRRGLGILILLFFSYFLMTVPIFIFHYISWSQSCSVLLWIWFCFFSCEKDALTSCWHVCAQLMEEQMISVTDSTDRWADVDLILFLLRAMGALTGCWSVCLNNLKNDLINSFGHFLYPSIKHVHIFCYLLVSHIRFWCFFSCL